MSHSHTREPLPLVLGVKRRLPRRHDPSSRDAQAEFARQRLAILERDEWRCRAMDCGFSSIQSPGAPAGGLEVHHIDDDHHYNDPANLITLCPLCHMAFSLGRRGNRFAATLGLMPQISQGELNLIHHMVWGMGRAVEMVEHQDTAARDTGWRLDDIPGRARRALEASDHALNELLLAAENALNRRLGEELPDIDDPGTLYGVLQALPQRVYRQRHRLLAPVRLLPAMAAFADEIDLWARTVWLKAYPPTSWVTLVEAAAKRMSRTPAASKAG